MHEELIGELQVLADAFDYGLAVKQAKTMRKAIAALSQPPANSGQLAVAEVFHDCGAMWLNWLTDEQAIPAGTKLYAAPPPPAAAPSGWLGIESAPKDGRTMILLLTPSRWPQVAYSNTWWTAGFSVECKPTHWMPLPALPDPSP